MSDNAPGKARAIVLFSGGLDSTLAAEVLRRAGVDVILLRHTSIFYPLRRGGYVPPCRSVIRDISEGMTALVANPRYGHGRNANPCLDCKQMMYGMAWREAQRQGADFIATGEVLGQRPMSQNQPAFDRMEKGAGVRGLVVRPLSGRLLPATIPEQKGLIRREDLLDIRGRSRLRQMALAAEWGITDYAQPAGGCRLTVPQYAERVFALAEKGFGDLASLGLVRHGRLCVLGGRAFVVIGRDDADNGLLLADAPAGSLILELRDRPGPLACLVGEASEENVEEARRLVVAHSRYRDLPATEVAASEVTAYLQQPSAP
jgi:tRNA U34 2-thiouridine synthase MnmA/TrmU